MKKLIAAIVPFLGGCVTSSPYVPVVEFGIGYEMPNRVIGDQGFDGIFRVRQPIVPGKVFLGYSHVSAINGKDIGTLDQIEFLVQMPLSLDR